jgi:hypothetical protein
MNALVARVLFIDCCLYEVNGCWKSFEFRLSSSTMAKPPSDIPNSTSSNPLDFGSCSGKRSSSVRKRTRDSGLIDDITAYPSKHAKFTDDSHKTRRVNPERLALRLDPELVAEMDVLITPGAKMPTFTIRKDLQERYNVDRRHIYDYFHSRGSSILSTYLIY